MKPRDVAILLIVAGAGLYVLKLKAEQASGAVSGALSDALGAVAAMPGRAYDAVAEAVGNVTSGFVQEAPNSGRVVNFAGARDTTPLDRYMRTWGNTMAARNAARAAGWTDDEIALSVLTIAHENGSIDGW